MEGRKFEYIDESSYVTPKTYFSVDRSYSVGTFSKKAFTDYVPNGYDSSERSLKVLKRHNHIYCSVDGISELYAKLCSVFVNSEKTELEDGDKLLFLKSAKFARRNLSSFSKYGKVKNLSLAKKVETADKIIGNIKELHKSVELFKLQSLDSTSNYRNYGFLIKSKDELTFMEVSSYALANFMSLGLGYFTSNDSEKCTETRMIDAYVRQWITKDDYEAELLVGLRYWSDKCYIDEQYIKVVEAERTIIDISKVYDTIGSTTMTLDEYHRINDKIKACIGSNNNTTLQVFLECLTSYDVSSSILYLSLLFRNNIFRNAHLKSLMNTNVAALYKYCAESSGFETHYSNSISCLLDITKKLSKSGFDVKIPASLLVKENDVNISRSFSYATSDITKVFHVEAKFSLLPGSEEYVDMDMSNEEINSYINNKN